MKKWVIFLTVFALIATACASGATTDTTSTVDGSQSSDDPFCIQVERTRVDFGVANDLHLLLNQRSVFYDDNVSADYILNEVLEEMFGYLSVYSSDIPQWARDIVDEEIERARESNSDPDFSVLNDVYSELVKDPRYSDLSDPSRLEEFLVVVFEGIIEALGDPFSSYMKAEHWLTGFADNSGRYQGVGMGTTMNSRGEISISFVEDGAPASKAGLKLGDAITKINGLSTESCTNQQFILRVRSLQDPKLTLEIAREVPGSAERDVFTIKVEKAEVKQLGISTYPAVELPNNRGTTLEGVPYRCGTRGIGLPCPFEDVDGDGVSDTLYVKIHEFSDQMRVDLEYALQKLDEEYGLDSFKGIVVDVRDNPGGLVSATMDAVDYFLSTSDVIFIQRDKGASGEPVSVYMRQNKVTYISPDTPIVVLMNDQSASGSEVFAAAMRDNNRATIVNDSERSRGKGTVNMWFTLKRGEYGAVYVSIGMWLTPKGEFIETRDEDNDGYDELGGLKPDIHVPWTDSDYAKNNRDVNYDPTLTAALDQLAKELAE
ncbi:MAG: S41 family peptidase [Candidatus Spechtbacterales bacterium]